MKALIKVGYGCNEHCTFCHTQEVRHIDGSADEVHAKIERAAQLGHTMVVFSGGEPTIRPELLEWADHVVRLGLDVGLVTNGLMLAYPEFVDKLQARRLRYVYQSLHGGSPRVHNSLVRADTFKAAWAAVGTLAGRGLDYTINTVVTRQNVDHLREIVDLLVPHLDVRLKFSMVAPKGGGSRAFDSLMPPVREVAARVVEAIAYGTERTNGRGRYAHDGIPFCLLPGLEDRYDDLKTHGYATMVEVGEPDFFPVDDKDKCQPEPCRGCALRGACPGLFAGYHEVFGHGELRPRTDRPRSNSFNYELETLVPATGGDCPIREDGVTPWDRGRHLFVRHGERVGRFRTTSRDFADVEIAATKHDVGQLYMDVSRKAAPDDFARDLVPLVRSALCEPCPERAHCTGLYEARTEGDNRFEQDDARVRTLLGTLRGAVLDVGCGAGPYEELLAPLATAGAIRYLGIDPDADTIGALRAARTWGTLEVGTGEGIALSPASFDHVLVLRSWNHFRDPRVALVNLVAALRPGGTLTIVDNVAFGLARTRSQVSRAVRSSAAFEHYRNDDAGDAHRLVESLGPGMPLNLLERHDVGPSTSNQWFVHYRRAC